MRSVPTLTWPKRAVRCNDKQNQIENNKNMLLRRGKGDASRELLKKWASNKSPVFFQNNPR